LRYSGFEMVANAHWRNCGLVLALVSVGSFAHAQSSSSAVLPLSARDSSTASASQIDQRTPNDGGLLPLPTRGAPPGLEPFFELNNSDIKFSFTRLTEVLRDKRHEGWVLAAYPDPKTSDPLIGAGFTLSLPARTHAQSDPLNPHQFLEPSSEQLWQAAGLDTQRLQLILGDYQSKLETWGTRKYRKKIRTGQLTEQVTEDEAAGLLRVAAVQAVFNARAYCRNFSELSASQQMALAQLVYQMGVNLEEFTQFLSLINQGPGLQSASLAYSAESTTPPLTDRQYWQEVQASLTHSQWARKYSGRAISVIAMFDPDYAEGPAAAERRVKATLRPAKHHHKKSKARSAKA
jgi:hypothetical protein